MQCLPCLDAAGNCDRGPGSPRQRSGFKGYITNLATCPGATAAAMVARRSDVASYPPEPVRTVLGTDFQIFQPNSMSLTIGWTQPSWIRVDRWKRKPTSEMPRTTCFHRSKPRWSAPTNARNPWKPITSMLAS
jgi:hypothetical protein